MKPTRFWLIVSVPALVLGCSGSEDSNDATSASAESGITCRQLDCTARAELGLLQRLEPRTCELGTPLPITSTWVRTPERDFDDCTAAECAIPDLEFTAAPDGSLWVVHTRFKDRETGEFVASGLGIPNAVLGSYGGNGEEGFGAVLPFERLTTGDRLPVGARAFPAMDSQGRIAIAMIIPRGEGQTQRTTLQLRRFTSAPDVAAVDTPIELEGAVGYLPDVRFNRNDELYVVFTQDMSPAGGLPATVLKLDQNFSVEWIHDNVPASNVIVSSAFVNPNGRTTTFGNLERTPASQEGIDVAQLDSDGRASWELASAPGDPEVTYNTIEIVASDAADSGVRLRSEDDAFLIEKRDNSGQSVWSLRIPRMPRNQADAAFDAAPLGPVVDELGRVYLSTTLSDTWGVIRIEADGSACSVHSVDPRLGAPRNIIPSAAGRIFYHGELALAALDFE